MTKPSDISRQLEEWLLWQNLIQPFFFKGGFCSKVREILASLPQSVELQKGEKGDLSSAASSPIDRLHASVTKCLSCRLGSSRTNTVFGEGSLNAEIMFIGEGPGRDEDLSGRPFVGKAGQLLTKIIENGMKIPRSSVYITNIVKCRPPENRDPLPDEAEACINFVKEEIAIVNPKVIVLLGKVAAKYLIGVNTSISLAREKSYSYGNAKLFVTYHPSALLRNASYKRPLWEDIKKVLSYLKS